jgi:uncharacterized membrane protein
VSFQQAELATLEAQIARVHAATGIRVLAAEIGKADTYEELTWKGFALGASLTALAVVAVGPQSLLLATLLPLAAGAAAALLAIFAPPVARLLLHDARAEVEVGQYAQGLFLRHELFHTPNRNAILLLVSRFERRVHILPDTGLHSTVGDAECRAIIERMSPALRAGHSAQALQAGLTALQEVLVRAGCQADALAASEPPEPVIEEKGA